MLIFGPDEKVMKNTKNFLSSKFDMKDLGEADLILGMKINKTAHGLALSQSHYVESIIKKFNFFSEEPLGIAYGSSVHLKKNKGNGIEQTKYAKIIGSVMYLMNCIRPDIAYAISRLSKYIHNPSQEHWNALSRLMRYLKGTVNVGIYFTSHPNVLKGYCDANWVFNNDETNSTGGYMFPLGGGAISWRSAK